MSFTYEQASARTALIVAGLLNRLDDQLGVARRLQSFAVGLSASTDVVATPAGQELLLSAMLQLRRMGMAVHISAPDAPLVATGPPFVGETLHAALASVKDKLLPGTQLTLNEPATVSIEFMLGSSIPTRVSALQLYATATAGRCIVSPTPNVLDIAGDARLTALGTASLVAAQGLRAFMREIDTENPAKDLNFAEAVVIDLVELLGFDPDELSNVDLGTVDFISAGAIAHGLLYTLHRFPGIALRGRTIEPKELDPPDLNRYAMALSDNLEQLKVKILEDGSKHELHITGIDSRYDGATRSTLMPLADTVAIGVDHVESRWFVQEHDDPAFLVVGATEGFEAFVSWHRPGTACAGCYHPSAPLDQATRIVPTISFVSFLAGYLTALLLAVEAAGRRLPPQTLHFRPFTWSGADVRAEALAPNPACPVGCQASRQKARAA